MDGQLNGAVNFYPTDEWFYAKPKTLQRADEGLDLPYQGSMLMRNSFFLTNTWLWRNEL